MKLVTYMMKIFVGVMVLGLASLSQAATIFGDPKGDITIVEYLDYNCPICRAYTPVLGYFASTQKGIKVIQRVVPVLNLDSQFVDSAVLASINQHQFPDMQAAILTVSDPETIPPEQVLAIADSLHLNRDQLLKDMQSQAIEKELLANAKAYDATGIKGVPVTVIYQTKNPNNRLTLSGNQTIESLTAAVQQIRGTK